MTDGGAPRRRSRRTPWLGIAGRIIVLGVAALLAARLLFGPQFGALLGSSRPVAIGVHNATGAPLRVTAVVPGGERKFYMVDPEETRLIPDDARELVSILDANCGIRDTHGRDSGTAGFVLAEVTEAEVTWIDTRMPATIRPAAPGDPCAVH